MESTDFNILFYFMNENFTVVEVELKDQPEGASKSETFHWLIKPTTQKEFSRLTFKSMGTEIVQGNEINIRTFTEAEIRFDKMFAKLSYNDDGHILMTESPKKLPGEIRTNIISYIGTL